MSKHLLVVDDDEYILELYEELLTEAGYKVDTAKNGQEGLDKIKKKSYNLVLLDVMMPILDGIEVLRKLKADKVTTPVVLLTNLAHDPVMKESKTLGAKAYLIKADYNPEQLLTKLKEYIS